jgi:RHS repeat-associated protein
MNIQTKLFRCSNTGQTSVWTVTETPGSVQPAIQKTVAGRTVSMVSSTAVTNAYTYDGFGRQVSATDGRGNTTVTAHNDLGQVAYTGDAAGNRTSYAYDGLGRKIAVTDPLGNTTHTTYDSAGNVTAQWGAAHPVAYEYDTAGRRIAMYTYRGSEEITSQSQIENLKSEMDCTRWLYDNATGLLTNKVYADGSRVRYTYTEGGLLATRVWSRGVTTAYSYDALGQLININYSDATPDVAFAYDRMGNMVSVTDASGIRVFTHDPDGKMLSDTLSALGQKFALLESYDTFGRNTGYALSNTVGGVSSLIAETEQGYDAFGRISEVSVSGIPAPFRYGWLPGSELQQSLAMPNGVTRQIACEPCRDLASSVVHTNASGTVLTRRVFSYDAAGNLAERTQYRLGDATNRLDVFSQNARGELVCAALGTNSYAYAFDDTGNRLTTEEPGFSAVYFANSLNQYTRISNSVPPCGFIPVFDADGNQTLIKTSTGIWHVTYNAENRPVCFSNDTAVIEMAYDHMGRRFEYKETASGAVARHERYLYRGYLQVAALDLLDGTNVLHAIVWDPTEPVATRPLALQTQSGWFAYGFDQVKNVTELFDASGGIAAAYDYAPFGAVTESSGPATAINPLTFSSEIDDAILGLIHYTFRPLNTLDGGWLNRDPIGERGGVNEYGFVENNPNNKTDYLGLLHWTLELDRLGVFYDEPYPHCLEPGYYRHCLSSCILRKLLGLFMSRGTSSSIALLIAMKYGGDIPFIDWDSGSLADIWSDIVGIVVSHVASSCESGCNKALDVNVRIKCCSHDKRLKKTDPRCCDGKK